MQHPHILPRHDMNQLARLNMPYLDKVRFESKNIRIIQSKCLRCSFPLDLPILPCSPAIPIDKEAEVGIVEKEFAVQSLDVDGLDVLFSCHKVE